MDQQDNQKVQKIKVEQQLKAGASWFYWIAGLSLVNSVLLLSGSEWGFIIGLGITQLIGAIGMAIAENADALVKVFAFLFSLIAAGVFVTFGVFANKRCLWAFIVGMVIYALDGLLFVLIQDWLSIGFHIFALFCIYSGLKAQRILAKTPETQSCSVEQPVPEIRDTVNAL